MKRMKHTVLLVTVVLICLSVQIAQQIHHFRWKQEWDASFQRANAIQVALEMLEVDGDPSGKKPTLHAELYGIMHEARASFQPNLIPGWLQACASLGLLYGIVGLWRMKNNAKDSEQSGGEVRV